MISAITVSHETPVEQMQKLLEERGAIRVTGLFAKYEVLEARDRLAARFSPENDVKHDEKDSEAVRGNLQKLKIGGINARTQPTRFMRIFYMEGGDLFDRLITFRNRLSKLPEDFAKSKDGPYWTARRIQQYPSGGGFLSAHLDVETASIAKQAGFLYVNPILLMSQKGWDYQTGGGFIGSEKERWEYERDCEVGDVIVCGANTLHGVADIDPHKPLDLQTLSGRLIASVTLMKRFTPEEARDYYQRRYESV